MRILISVLSCKSNIYSSLEKTIRETWGFKKYKNVDIIYYHGSHVKNESIGDIFLSTSPEGLYNIGYKTLDMFEHFVDEGYDYIFRTNLSSYVNISKLIEFVSDKPRNNFYSGIIGTHGYINFASGSGYFISNDLVRRVLHNRESWDHNLIDDVALGKMVKEFNISIYPGKRMDLISNDIVYRGDHYHYRCKHDHDRSKDIETLKTLYKYEQNE